MIEFRNYYFDIMLYYLFFQKFINFFFFFYNSFPNPEAHNVNYTPLKTSFRLQNQSSTPSPNWAFTKRGLRPLVELWPKTSSCANCYLAQVLYIYV